MLDSIKKEMRKRKGEEAEVETAVSQFRDELAEKRQLSKKRNPLRTITPIDAALSSREEKRDQEEVQRFRATEESRVRAERSERTSAIVRDNRGAIIGIAAVLIIVSLLAVGGVMFCFSQDGKADASLPSPDVALSGAAMPSGEASVASDDSGKTTSDDDAIAASDNVQSSSSSSSATSKPKKKKRYVTSQSKPDLSPGDVANYLGYTVTVHEPIEAIIVSEKGHDQAYVSIPVTFDAKEDATISAGSFGYPVVVIASEFPSSVTLAAGDTYTANVFIPWHEASRTTDPSIDMKAPASQVSYSDAGHSTTWSIDYESLAQSRGITIVDETTALSSVYGTTIQATARLDICYGGSYGNFLRLNLGNPEHPEAIVDIEAFVSDDVAAKLENRQRGDEVTIQGTVGNITADIDGTEWTSTGLYLTDVQLVDRS